MVDISLSEALDIVRRWQGKGATINGTMFTDPQELQTVFSGHVTVRDGGIVVTSENGLELLRITLSPDMTITYGESESVLAIQHSGYRCVLYERKS